jgi:hypothetical protein
MFAGFFMPVAFQEIPLQPSYSGSINGVHGLELVTPIKFIPLMALTDTQAKLAHPGFYPDTTDTSKKPIMGSRSVYDQEKKTQPGIQT